MRRFGALLAAGLLAGTLAACGGTETQEMESAQAFAMDTVMVLTAGGGETGTALRERPRRSSTAWTGSSPAPGRTAPSPG